MKRLDVEDPLVFDKWRTLYNDLSHEENIQFGYDMEAKYPGQASFNPVVFEQLFARLGGAPHVVEIGGWKGELARHLMTKLPVASWHNIDMCKAAIEKTVPMGCLPFTAQFPDRFDWFLQPRTMQYDLCVSAHSIEHLSNAHLLALMNWISGIPTVIFEAPIAMTGQTWGGYFGTHILEMGWNDINAAMKALGYSAERINDWVFLYEVTK